MCTLFSKCVRASLLTSMPACVYISVYVCVWFTLKGPHSSSEAQWWPGARQAHNRVPVVWLAWSCVSSFGRNIKKCLSQESNFCTEHLVHPIGFWWYWVNHEQSEWHLCRLADSLEQKKVALFIVYTNLFFSLKEAFIVLKTCLTTHPWRSASGKEVTLQHLNWLNLHSHNTIITVID